MEVTEIEVAKMLFNNKVDTAWIESNNGGRGFARNVERLLWENHKSRKTAIIWYHQSANKISKILAQAPNVMRTVLFPINWKQMYKDFAIAIDLYKSKGKNLHDDGPDTLSELTLKMTSGTKIVNVRM